MAERLSLHDLTVVLGESFEAKYQPVGGMTKTRVAQVELSGQVHVAGLADPDKVHVEGTIKLESGEVGHLSHQMKAHSLEEQSFI